MHDLPRHCPRSATALAAPAFQIRETGTCCSWRFR